MLGFSKGLLMNKMGLLVGDVVLGLLVAGVLAPLTLVVLPESVQGSGALAAVAVASVALVMAVHWFIKRPKS